MDLETVLYNVEDGVGVIRLNRPSHMNAVIEQMYVDIQAVLREAQDDESVRDLVHNAPHRDFKTVILVEAEAILACMNTTDWHEGIASFGEKRKPVFTGR